MTQEKMLSGKVALITGASQGIGAAIAKAYARHGAHVILVARSLENLEKIDDAIREKGGETTLVPLDLKEGKKIDELGGVINERFGKLDILIGNAGLLGKLGPVSHTDPKIWQDVMDINVTANYRLLRSFDPLLRQSDDGVALFVTSAITEFNAPYWGAYSASKAALNMLVKTYAAEVEKLGVRAYIMDPGIVRTDMRAAAMPGEDPETVAPPEEIAEKFVETVLQNTLDTGSLVKCQAA